MIKNGKIQTKNIENIYFKKSFEKNQNKKQELKHSDTSHLSTVQTP